MSRQSRIVAQRNHLGAFFGGVFGLTAGWLFHPLGLCHMPFAFQLFALSVGCFVGVVLGYYYNELYEIARNSYLQTINVLQRGREKCPRPNLSHLNWLTYIPAIATYATGAVAAVTITLFTSIPTLLDLTKKGVIHFFDVRRNWIIPYCRRNRTNRIVLLRSLAVILFIAINYQQALFFSAAHPSENTIEQIQQGIANPGSDIFGPPILLIFPIMLTIGLTFAPAYSTNQNKLFTYALRLNHRYDKAGPIGFLLYDLFALFRMEIVVFASIASFVLGFFFCAAIGILLVLPLFFSAICLAKIARLLITETGHWLCYLVTLGVTLLSFTILYPYLTWLTVGFIAPLNGAVAYLSITAARQLSARTLRQHSIFRQLARQTTEKNMEMGSAWIEALFGTCFWPTYTGFVARQAA